MNAREAQEAYENLAASVMFRVINHFKNSREPMYVPRALWDAVTPYLTGLFDVEETPPWENPELPATVTIRGWIPPLS